MGTLVYRFLFADFWVPVWPNIAAAVVGWSYVNWRQTVRHRRSHEELKAHITHVVHAALKEHPHDDLHR
jgi:hypothetical protein